MEAEFELIVRELPIEKMAPMGLIHGYEVVLVHREPAFRLDGGQEKALNMRGKSIPGRWQFFSKRCLLFQ